MLLFWSFKGNVLKNDNYVSKINISKKTHKIVNAFGNLFLFISDKYKNNFFPPKRTENDYLVQMPVDYFPPYFLT